jgi:hypothetical protein
MAAVGRAAEYGADLVDTGGVKDGPAAATTQLAAFWRPPGRTVGTGGDDKPSD